MANTKISALTSATTPLAGTETLPVVQSGATKQVSVANLTAGRTQTSNGIVQGTAATGYNFTANTPAAGMTSQLLNWYETGTWTPTDGSGAGLSFTLGTCTYIRKGREVTCYAVITYPATASVAVAKIQGFPFTPGDRIYGQISYTSVATSALNYIQGAGAFVYLWTPGNQVTNVTMSSGLIIFSASYNI